MKDARERERRGAPQSELRAVGAAQGMPGAAERPYASPRLECFGDLRTLTLGGSPGLGDSGSAFIEQP